MAKSPFEDLFDQPSNLSSPVPSGGSSFSGLFDSPAPAAPKEEGGGFSFNPMDMVKNIPGGLLDLGQGLMDLGLGVAKDAGSLVREGFDRGKTGGGFGNQEIDNRYSYSTDELLKGLIFDPGKVKKEGVLGAVSPVLQQTTEEYGFNPIRGDLIPSPSKSLRHLEQDPVAVATDALALYTAGGSLASKVASGAARTEGVASELANLGSAARAGEVADVSRTARFVDAVHPGRKFMEIGEDVGPGGRLEAINQLTGRVSTREASMNPARRSMEQFKFNLGTKDTETLHKRLGVIDEALTDPPEGTPVTRLRTERDQIQGILNSAETQGVGRVKSPRSSDREVGKLASRIVNESGTYFIRGRSKAIEDARGILKSVPPEDMPGFHRRLIGLDDTVGAGRLAFDDVATAIQGPLDESPRLQKVAEVVAPHIEKVKEMETLFSDPVQLANHPIGQKVASDFMEELRKAGRFEDAPPFTSHASLLDDSEQAQLAGRMQVAGAEEVEKSKRLIEIVGGEPLASARAGLDDVSAEVMDNLRLHNFEGEAAQLLETGGDYGTLFDRLYQPLQVKHAFENNLDSLDDVPSALELDDLRRTGNVKAPVYYPQYGSLSAKDSDFLAKNRTHGMGVASDPKTMRHNRGRLMMEYLEGTKDAYITDPSDAYARLASEWAAHKEAARVIDRIKETVGMKITAKDQLPEGWVVINPDANRLMLRRDMDVRLKASQALKDGLDPHSAFARAVEDVFTDDKGIDELLANRGDIYAVPKVAADKLTEAMRWSIPTPVNKHLRVWVDSPINAWRATTLYMSPRFYVNNVAGNTVFLGLQGGPKAIAGMVRNLDKRYVERIRAVTDELNITENVEGGIFSETAQRSTSLGPALETRAGRALGAVKESKVGEVAHGTLARGQKLNAVFEDSARRESFLTAAEKDMARRGVKLVGNKFIRDQKRMEQILKYGVDNPKSVERWLDGMNDTMNNYAASGAFERKVMRRFIAPFWSFYKHAAKTLIRMPYKHPFKAELFKALDNMDEELKKDQMVPDWLEGAQPVGDYLFNPRGMNPFSGMSEQFVNQLTPAIKVPLERQLGESLYDGKQFSGSPEDSYTDFSTGQAYELDAEGNPVPTTVLPSFGEHLLQQSPLYKLARDLTSGGARYDTGETIMGPDGQPKYPTDPLMSLLRYSGIPLYQYDTEGYAQEEAARRAKAAAAIAAARASQP